VRVPVSWLRALLPTLTASADEIAAALVRAGLEVEQVHRVGHDVSDVVVGQVLDVEELTEFKKPIRFCHVAISETTEGGSKVHDVVCGATNFAAGDKVCFALPGAVLPGGFTISTRQTYGHTSDGMICSTAELGLPGDASGILVLPTGVELGADVVELLHLRDEVLDIAITPDRGYQLSLRGIAREAATAFGLTWHDPGLGEVPTAGEGWPVALADPGCTRFVASVATGLSATAPSPLWLQRRLSLAGMRPISLAVDVTNHVMLELGQPLHAYDLRSLQGEVVVRRAHPDERLTTLDGVDRALDPADLVIADDRGAIGLAGVMGGASTEVSEATTDVVIEAAHFDAVSIAKTARRHKLPSEASRRFERGVDPALCAVAAETAVRLLVALGGAEAGPVTDLDQRPPVAPIPFSVDHPGRVAGRHYEPGVVQGRLTDVGCVLAGDGIGLAVTPPSWRPDLVAPIDLVEEVIRLEGFDTVPSELPTAPAGRGLTDEQRLRRTASRALAAAGLVEVTTPPFVAAELLTKAGGAPPSPRLVNPLSEEQALLRPLLLPTLLATAERNVARGLADVAIFEVGQVFQGAGTSAAPPPATGRPTDAQLADLDAALPHQPRHAALVLAGSRAGRPVDWADAVEALVSVGTALGLVLAPQRATEAQAFHPGRCAALLLDGRMVGLAGEIHPRVVEALGLPPRTVGAEFGLDGLVAAAAARGPVAAPVVSPFPPSAVDVALVVADTVPAADVEAALREGAGPLLEVLRLFDVYAGPQVGEGHRSLAFTLRFRAPDRTLTDDEVMPARDAAIALAGERTGAVLRS
jgi:phenylalanyl-tRNA synthetase beta chain